MTLLGTENLIREFGGLVAIDDVNLTVEEDEHVSIIGPDGTGKPMLINLITRRLGPISGDIRFKGESIIGLGPHRTTQRGISRSFQTASILPDPTIRRSTEIAALAAERGALDFELLRHHDNLTDIHGVARDTLDSVRLLDHANTIATDLPYGDKRRLETGITLASGPGLFLMGEPTADMSPEETKSTVDLIEQVKHDHGLTFVLVEHDMGIVFSISDRIIVLSCDGIIAEGTPGEIRGNETVQEAYLGGVEL